MVKSSGYEGKRAWLLSGGHSFAADKRLRRAGWRGAGEGPAGARYRQRTKIGDSKTGGAAPPHKDYSVPPPSWVYGC